MGLLGGRWLWRDLVHTLGLCICEAIAGGLTENLLNPTRLETRTKESNMCASIWVINPNA